MTLSSDSDKVLRTCPNFGKLRHISVYFLTLTSEVKESAHKFLSKHKKEDKERNKEGGIEDFSVGSI